MHHSGRGELLFREGGMQIMDLVGFLANLCTIIEFLYFLIKRIKDKNADNEK